MSEYIEIETELSDDGQQMEFYTNLILTVEGVELYESADEMAEGSPVAQALAAIDGIARLRIEERDMVIARLPDAAWHGIVSDVAAALKDFFL